MRRKIAIIQSAGEHGAYWAIMYCMMNTLGILSGLPNPMIAKQATSSHSDEQYVAEEMGRGNELYREVKVVLGLIEEGFKRQQVYR